MRIFILLLLFFFSFSVQADSQKEEILKIHNGKYYVDTINRVLSSADIKSLLKIREKVLALNLDKYSKESSIHILKKYILTQTYYYEDKFQLSLELKNCEAGEVKILHGKARKYYQTKSVTAGNMCKSETRFCRDGILSGSYTATGCTIQEPQVIPPKEEPQVILPKDCTENEIILGHGQSGSYYKTKSVTAGNMCESETRFCRDGVLSGSYTEANCSIEYPNFNLSISNQCSSIYPLQKDTEKTTYFWKDKIYATLDGETMYYNMSTPKQEGKYPLILLVHGGGFTEYITKERFGEYMLRELARQGYAVVTIDYSQASKGESESEKNYFPRAIQDVRCAIRYFKSGRDTNLRFIDTEKIGVIGTSAGGHIALLLGTSENIQDFNDEECPYSSTISPRVQSVVAMYPSTRFYTTGGKEWEQYKNVSKENDFYKIFGSQPSQNIELIKKGSPQYHAEQYTGESYIPPMLFIDAQGDETKRPWLVESVKNMTDALAYTNIPYISFTQENASHGYDPFINPLLSKGQTSPEDVPENQRFIQTSCTILDFFQKTLKN